MNENLSRTEVLEDFDLLIRALREAHSGLHRYSTKAEMDLWFGVQRAKLGREITRGKFEAVVAKTLARIKCGHTSMRNAPEVEAEMKNARMFPLRLLVEGRRLMVLFNDTPDDRSIRPGMEVVEVNGHDASELVDRFLAVLPADGDIETDKLRGITRDFARYYWWLVEQADEFTVKAKDSAGEPIIAKLTGVTEEERMNNQNPANDLIKAGIDKLRGGSRENLSLRFVKVPQIAVVRLRYFVGDDFRQQVESVFKTLREKGIETLILDLRGNGGGDDMYGAMLVSCLTDKPFRYFDHINVKTIKPTFIEHTDLKTDDTWLSRLRDGTEPNPSGGFRVTTKLHPGLAEQQPGKDPFLGKVFVLIDGGTFSTAADVCAVLHHLNRGTFVGEETGGGYYGNNSGLMPTLTLPYSKVKVRLPMYEYWNAVPGYDGNRHGTRPDHPVRINTRDLLRGIDPQLNRALEIADRSGAAN